MRRVPRGVRIDVRCVPKWRASLQGKSRGKLGEARSLNVKPSQLGGESGLGSRERSTESGNCTAPG